MSDIKPEFTGGTKLQITCEGRTTVIFFEGVKPNSTEFIERAKASIEQAAASYPIENGITWNT